MENKNRKLQGYEKFAFIVGIIGLVADFITIITFVTVTNNNAENNSDSSIILHLLLISSIFYSWFIISWFVIRHNYINFISSLQYTDPKKQNENFKLRANRFGENVGKTLFAVGFLILPIPLLMAFSNTMYLTSLIIMPITGLFLWIGMLYLMPVVYPDMGRFSEYI